MANILVIGEHCTDVFIYGNSIRKSPEGDAPVFTPVREVYNDGMALNTYNNLIALGVNASYYVDNGRIEKVRYVNDSTNELYLRVDENDKVDRINLNDLPDLNQFDAVIISDYDKGFLSGDDIQYIGAHSKLTVLDTKKTIGDWCDSITFIKLNKHEYSNNYDFIETNNDIFKKVICTLEGIGAMYAGVLYDTTMIPNPDVCGAGDTFTAAFTSRYVECGDVSDSIRFANKCAGLVVGKLGVATV